jgi:recombination protein RecA
VTHEIIQKSGAWFSFENEKIGQGRESTRKHLKDNPKVAAKIKKLVIEKIKTKPKV